MKPLDELYLEWLYEQVANPNVTDPRRTYWRLLKQLHDKQAVWRVRYDDNRLAEGKYLRFEFADALGVSIEDEAWMGLECSVLELMVGLARNLCYEDLAERDTAFWFWKMIENIGLRHYTDADSDQNHIDGVLDRVLLRKYDADGNGGFFPLRNPSKDQRSVELWYQLSAYVMEQN